MRQVEMFTTQMVGVMFYKAHQLLHSVSALGLTKVCI
jgi:hypothetical protein